MRWGLLSGLGAGISQGAQLLNQGMQEDRNARREAEREARREAIEAAREKAAESRWRESFEFQKQQAQEQRQFQNQRAAVEDQRYKDNKEYQLNRDKVTDSRYASEASLRQIEGEMDRAYKDARESAREIANRFDTRAAQLQKEREALYRVKSADDPLAALGQESGQTSIKSPAQIEARIKQIEKSLNTLDTQREQQLSKFRAESNKLISDIASQYDPAVVKASSFKGYVNAINSEISFAAEVAKERESFKDFASGAMGADGKIAAPTGTARDALGNKIPATTPITTSPAAPQEQQTRLQYGVDIAGKAVKGNAGLLADFLIPAAGAFADNVYKPAWDWLNSPMPPQQPQPQQPPKQNR